MSEITPPKWGNFGQSADLCEFVRWKNEEKRNIIQKYVVPLEYGLQIALPVRLTLKKQRHPLRHQINEVLRDERWGTFWIIALLKVGLYYTLRKVLIWCKYRKVVAKILCNDSPIKIFSQHCIYTRQRQVVKECHYIY